MVTVAAPRHLHPKSIRRGGGRGGINASAGVPTHESITLLDYKAALLVSKVSFLEYTLKSVLICFRLVLYRFRTIACTYCTIATIFCVSIFVGFLLKEGSVF